MEIWKPIKNYENLYNVSNLGRVKSLSRFVNGKAHGEIVQYLVKEKILKPRYCGRNYEYVYYELHKNGDIKKYYAHRLVAETFIPNPNNLETVNHKNGRKRDNRVNNLEWMSYTDNNIHAVKTNLRKPKINKILCIELNLEFINPNKAAEFIKSQGIQANQHTIYGNILSVCKNNKGTAYKYHWKFI